MKPTLLTDAVTVEPVSRFRTMTPPVKALPRFSRARALFARLKNGSRLTLVAATSLMVAPDIWYLLLMATGFGLLVAGVYVLAGPGWALIAGGVACILTAAFVRKGLTGG